MLLKISVCSQYSLSPRKAKGISRLENVSTGQGLETFSSFVKDASYYNLQNIPHSF